MYKRFKIFDFKLSILETLKNTYIGKIVEIFQEECFQSDSNKWRILDYACVESYNRENEEHDWNKRRAIIPIKGIVIDVRFNNNYDDSEYTIIVKEIVVGTENVSCEFYCELKFF